MRAVGIILAGGNGKKMKQLSALNKELDIGNKDETAIMMDDEVIEEPTRNKELCR